MNPSTQDLLRAVEKVGAEHLLLLPNDKNIILAAEQVRQLTAKQMSIVPTRTVPQGIAALLAFNYQSDLATNERMMTAATQRVRTVEVTAATRSVKLNDLDVREGQFIGLIDGELIRAGDDREQLTVGLLKQAEAEHAEIITVYYGDQVDGEQVNRFQKKLQSTFPKQEVEMHSGGQPLYPYIISVE